MAVSSPSLLFGAHPAGTTWPAASRVASIRSHARGALLGLAIGDALGATVEFMTPTEIRAQYGRHDRIRGGGWLRLPLGAVTDDTTMAFALAEALIAHDSPRAEDYADAFDGWMRSKPVDVGNTVRRGIVRYRRTGEACVPPSEDAGNGATMRCAPVAIALLNAPDEALTATTLAQARVTHHNPLTDAATVAVVQMIRGAILGGGIRYVMQRAHALVGECPRFAFRGRPSLNPSGYIIDTMLAVLQAIDLNDSFEGVLVDVVNRGGDADTTGAIAGAIAGALCGDAALPPRWLATLRPGVVESCVLLTDALLAKQGITCA
jgi:ADP-ribosyl-[dinitrogen reductase] hydrolase